MLLRITSLTFRGKNSGIFQNISKIALRLPTDSINGGVKLTSTNEELEVKLGVYALQ